MAREQIGSDAPAMQGDSEVGRYAFLQGRAKAFLIAGGGAAGEDALIRHVFGSGPPALWRPLLHQMLAASDAFELRADGHWALPGFAPPAADAPLLGDTPYVVLDVETTGLKPSRQRIIEIAALRVRGGREEGLFSTLLQPDLRVPDYIAGLTGITQAMLEDAPRFAAIAADLLQFLSDDLIVGHNVGFDIAFLNAELRRAGRPALLNGRLDTLALAVGVLPGLRKTGLDRVAATLGVAPPGGQRHRAEPDARLTAAVLERLLPRARERGIHALADLQRVAGGRGTASAGEDGAHEAVGRGRAVLDRALLADLPELPGCYIMRDARGAPIYVGKAKNLRDRVGSYYSQHLGYGRRKDGLLEAIARIDHVVVGSELEALLLESQLIRRHTPRYNVQGRNYEHYPYIKVDLADAWPRVFATRRRRDDGARYFGPYRNGRGVRRTVELLTEILPLRTCQQRARSPERQWAPCLRLSLGKCLGPCAGRTTPAAYGALVADVVRFLEGDATGVTAQLWTQLEAAAERLDFERAAHLRNALRHVQAVALEGEILTGAVATDDLLLVLPAAAPGAVEALLLTRGRLWAQLRVGRDEPPAAVADRLRASRARARAADLPPVDHESVDEINLLSRWLHRHHGRAATFALPDADTPDAWVALALAVQRCDPDPPEWSPEADDAPPDAPPDADPDGDPDGNPDEREDAAGAPADG